MTPRAGPPQSVGPSFGFLTGRWGYAETTSWRPGPAHEQAHPTGSNREDEQACVESLLIFTKDGCQMGKQGRSDITNIHLKSSSSCSAFPCNSILEEKFIIAVMWGGSF